MIWRFRYSKPLKNNGKALVKFLQSARLDVEKERQEAMRLFNSWQQMELEDALPLLSIKFAANPTYSEQVQKDAQLADVYNEIRAKAVRCLENESTRAIKSIMLQLVQAYRYENFEKSELKTFFFNQVFKNLDIANSFHWLVHLDKENNKSNDPEILQSYVELYTEFMDILENNYPEYHLNIQTQLEFRKSAVTTAFKIRQYNDQKKSNEE